MIWKVDKPRPIINQFVAYWSTITFSPILIAVSIILTAKVQGLVLSEDWAEYTYVQSFTLKAIPYILTWIAFFLVYKLIPYTNVHFVPALYGAVAGGAMFEVAKLFFDYYILNWASYTVIYGALAIIPIFLFWLYVTWLIVLLGSVIAYAIQYPKEIHSVKQEGFDRSKYLNYYTLRLLVEASRSYLADEGSLKPRETQEKLEITAEFYGDILIKLKKLGIIEFIDGTNEKFLLSKPPENILIADLMANLNGETLQTSPEPVDSDRAALALLFSAIDKSIKSGIENLNLAQLTSRLEKERNAVSVGLVNERTEIA
jgi:membrane protein